MLETELTRLRTRLAHMQGESAAQSDTHTYAHCVCLSIYLSIHLSICVCVSVSVSVSCLCLCLCSCVRARTHTRACTHQVRRRRSWKGSNGSTQSPSRAPTSTTSRPWTTSRSATTSSAASTCCCSCNGPASVRWRRPTVQRRGRHSVLVFAGMLQRRSRGVASAWTLCESERACM